jgi:hypothetical protein
MLFFKKAPFGSLKSQGLNAQLSIPDVVLRGMQNTPLAEKLLFEAEEAGDIITTPDFSYILTINFDVNPTNQLGSGITVDFISGNLDNISFIK